MMMMRKIYLFAIGILIVLPGFSQQSDAPTKVVKAAFFDKSLPLRDQPMLQMKADNGRTKAKDKNNWFKDRLTGNEDVITHEESIQSKQGNKNTKGPIVNINGIGNVNGVYPPDTDGDVSPDHFVQMINLSFAIYEKNGTKIYGPAANSTLWSGFPGPWSGSNDGDPIIFWDDLSERWVASQFAVSTSNGIDYELLAVSETSDPTGSWYRYAFEFDMFPDYPKISAWTDGYYATFHMFQIPNFAGTAYAVFEKEKMLIGDPDAQMIYFGEYGNRWAFLPADCDGVAPPAGTSCNFTGINFFGNQYMQIFELTPDWNNPNNSSLTMVGNLDTDAFNSNVSGIPQPGTGTQLDAFSNNLMYRLPYRNFGTHQAMVANHAVNISGHTGIRWYEMRDEGSGWYIYQSGTYSPDNDNRWMGSMAISSNGNIALGYSVSSGSTYPSLRYTGRTPEAPLGEMNIEEVELIAGLSSQTGINRWGDYASMTCDPSDPDVFWFTSEYMKSNGWGTRIGSFNFDALQQPEIYAGDDSFICDDVLYQTSANGQAYTSVLWTSDGDGIFQNPTSLDAKYLRGNDDIANGGFTLSITVQGYEPGWEATDEVYVAIVTAPDANAGNDTTIHMNHMAYLNGQAGDYSTVEWTSDGDGSFANATEIITTYTPGSGDISNGQVQLTLTAQAMEPCEGEDADNVVIIIDPTVGIGQSRYSDNFVKVIPNPSNGQFSVQISGRDLDENFSFSVLDYTGRVVLSDNYTAGQLSNKVFDLSSYPKGLYFMEIRNEGFNALEKIVMK